MRICAIPQTGLHCADVYYTAQYRGCSGSAAKYCMVLCNFVNGRFIALMFTTLHSIVVVPAALLSIAWYCAIA